MKYREGKIRRRKLEFQVVRDQIQRRGSAFYQRIRARLEQCGDCFVYRGSKNPNGYARVNFKYKGQHVGIDAHRLFLLLKLGRPIRLGFDAGHTCGKRDCVLHIMEQHYTSNALTDPDGENLRPAFEHFN